MSRLNRSFFAPIMPMQSHTVRWHFVLVWFYEHCVVSLTHTHTQNILIQNGPFEKRFLLVQFWIRQFIYHALSYASYFQWFVSLHRSKLYYHFSLIGQKKWNKFHEIYVHYFCIKWRYALLHFEIQKTPHFWWAYADAQIEMHFIFIQNVWSFLLVNE